MKHCFKIGVYLTRHEQEAARIEAAVRGQSLSAFLRSCMYKEVNDAISTRRFLAEQFAGQEQFDYARGLLGASDNAETRENATS